MYLTLRPWKQKLNRIVAAQVSDTTEDDQNY